MLVALWKLFTNEQAFSEFWAGHGAVVLRVAVAAAGEAAKQFGTTPELWWIGSVAQILALGFQGGDKNTNKTKEE